MYLEEIYKVIELTVDIFSSFDDRLQWHRTANGNWRVDFTVVGVVKSTQSAVVETLVRQNAVLVSFQTTMRSGNSVLTRSFEVPRDTIQIRDWLSTVLAQWYGDVIQAKHIGQ